jgi:hypothetical protein
MTIREFENADIHSVARLYLKAFHGIDAEPSQELSDYFRLIYLEHPWLECGQASLVGLDDTGRIEAFIGVLPVRMNYRDETLKLSVCTTLMVDPDAANRLAGGMILRAFLRRGQDFSYSDNASRTSQAMWEKLGGCTAPLRSLDFRLILRPAYFYFRSNLRRNRYLASLAKPMLPILDRVLSMARAPGHWISSSDDRTIEAADDESLAQVILAAEAPYIFRPAWTAEVLAWILQLAERRASRGAIRKLLVRSRTNEVLGAAIYYGAAGTVAEVIDIYPIGRQADAVVMAVARDAYEHGCVALEGKLHDACFDPMSRLGFSFRYGSASLLHSRNDSLVSAVLTGRASLGGLAGEGWSRLVGDDFAPLDLAGGKGSAVRGGHPA